MRGSTNARLVALGCAAALLAGCGGGGPVSGYKGKMPEAMKPCDAANKELPKALAAARTGKMTFNEARAEADKTLATCEAALSAWKGLKDMPPKVAEACIPEAEAKVQLAYASRNALDHQMSKHYKTLIDRAALAVEKAVAACKEAQKG